MADNKIKQELPFERQEILIEILKARFEKNRVRHPDVNWKEILLKLQENPQKLWSINEMEETGGEPDLITFGQLLDVYIFCDCSAESPKGRRNTCYDRAALESRKEHKPQKNAIEMAADMGIELLSEEAYRELQEFGEFDSKTSSWIKTPEKIRKLGGALFGDRRYDTVFVYHNGVGAYYSVRGFRGLLRV